MPKKSFKDSINPAMNFISQESIERAEGIQEPATAPEGYKLNPLYVETKSRRLQLLIQPSLHEKLKKRAEREHTSVNDLIHTILQEELRGE